MKISEIDQVKTQFFSTKVEEKQDHIELHLVGELDLVSPAELLSLFLKSFHEYLKNYRIKEVMLNIRELRFINSSGIKILLNWLLSIKTLKTAEQYRIGLVYNKAITWQVSAFKALTVFAGDCFYLIEE